MSMPDVEEFSEIHQECPFCGGEYVVVRGSIRHDPLRHCEKWDSISDPLAFKRAAEDEERRKRSVR
jgi:hypothetical protein